MSMSRTLTRQQRLERLNILHDMANAMDTAIVGLEVATERRAAGDPVGELEARQLRSESIREVKACVADLKALQKPNADSALEATERALIDYRMGMHRLLLT